MVHLHQLRTGSSLLGVALLVCMTPAAAQSVWDVVPEIGMRVESEDNVLLRQGESAGSASRSVLNAGASITNFSERGVIYFQPSVRADAYLNSTEDDFDSEDYFFRTGGQYQWEKVAGGFRADYSRISVLRAELGEILPPDFDPTDPDPEEPIDPDSGRLEFFNEYRHHYVLGGNLDFQLSERNRFRFDARRSQVEYSGLGDLAQGRSPFDVTTVGMTIARRVDERNRVSARMFASRYNADRNDNSTTTVGVEGRFARPLSQTWTLNLGVGVERTDFEFIRLPIEQRVDNADTNVTFRLGLRQRGQRSQLDMDLRRRVSPNASGFMVIREEVSAYWTHAFRPRLQGIFGVRVFENRTVGNVNRTDEREYARGELGFRWALSQRMFLEGGYAFTAQRFTREETDRATSNGVFLGFGYRGLSRMPQ